MRAALLSLLLIACTQRPGAGDAGVDAGEVDGGTDAGMIVYPPLTAEQIAVLAARPYRLVVPAGYDGGTAVPFVMLLHGYSADGMVQDNYFKMSALAQTRTFLLATPDGLMDGAGQRYWNATDYCCGFNTVKTDDVAYLIAIMDEVRLKYRVDPQRVFFVGHSNGGFMSHRMACDHPDRLAAFVSLAGAQWKDVSKCAPPAGQKVSVLQVHGEMDAVITYPGTLYYPGAVETVRDWGTLNGCAATAFSGAGVDLDLVTDLAAAETKREQLSGCAPGVAVELWTIRAGSHIPAFNDTWAPTLYDWLVGHPKR